MAYTSWAFGETDTANGYQHNRKGIIKAARDLHYPPIVIEKLKEAKTIAQMTNIMKDARNGKYDS